MLNPYVTVNRLPSPQGFLIEAQQSSDRTVLVIGLLDHKAGSETIVAMFFTTIETGKAPVRSFYSHFAI